MVTRGYTGTSVRGTRASVKTTTPVAIEGQAPRQVSRRTTPSRIETAKQQQAQLQAENEYNTAVNTTKELVEGGYFEDVKTVEDYEKKYEEAPEVSKQFLLTPQSVKDEQQTKLTELQTKIDEKIAENEAFKQSAIDKFKRQEQRYDERKDDLKKRLDRGKITKEKYEEYLARAKIDIKEDEDDMEEKVEYRDAYNQKLKEAKSKININVTPEWKYIHDDAYTYADYIRNKEAYRNELSQAKYEQKINLEKLQNLGYEKQPTVVYRVDPITNKPLTQKAPVSYYNPTTGDWVKVSEIDIKAKTTKPTTDLYQKSAEVSVPFTYAGKTYYTTQISDVYKTAKPGVFTTEYEEAPIGLGQIDISSPYTQRVAGLKKLYVEDLTTPTGERVKRITDVPKAEITSEQVVPFTTKITLEQKDLAGNITTKTEDTEVYYNPEKDTYVTKYGEVEFAEPEKEEQKTEESKKAKEDELKYYLDVLKYEDAKKLNMPESKTQAFISNLGDYVADASNIIPGSEVGLPVENVPEGGGILATEFASTTKKREESLKELEQRETLFGSKFLKNVADFGVEAYKVPRGAFKAFFTEAVPTVFGAGLYGAKYVGTEYALPVARRASTGASGGIYLGEKYVAKPIMKTGSEYIEALKYLTGETKEKVTPIIVQKGADIYETGKDITKIGAGAIKYVGEPVIKTGAGIITSGIETISEGGQALRYLTGEARKKAAPIVIQKGTDIYETGKDIAKTGAETLIGAGMVLGYAGEEITKRTAPIVVQKGVDIYETGKGIVTTGAKTISEGGQALGYLTGEARKKTAPIVIQKGTDIYETGKDIAKTGAETLIGAGMVLGYVGDEATKRVVPIVVEKTKPLIDYGAKALEIPKGAGEAFFTEAVPTVGLGIAGGGKWLLDKWTFEVLPKGMKEIEPYIGSTDLGAYWLSSMEQGRIDRLIREEKDRIFGTEKSENLNKAYEAVTGIIEGGGSKEAVTSELIKYGYNSIDEFNADIEEQQKFVALTETRTSPKKIFQEKVEKGETTKLETLSGDVFYGLKPLTVPLVGGALSLTPLAPIGTGILVGYGGSEVGKGVEKLTGKYKSPGTILQGAIETAIGTSFIVGPLAGGYIKSGAGKVAKSIFGTGKAAKATQAAYLSRPQAAVKSLIGGGVAGGLVGTGVGISTYKDTKDIERSIRAGVVSGAIVGTGYSAVLYPKLMSYGALTEQQKILVSTKYKEPYYQRALQRNRAFVGYQTDITRRGLFKDYTVFTSSKPGSKANVDRFVNELVKLGRSPATARKLLTTYYKPYEYRNINIAEPSPDTITKSKEIATYNIGGKGLKALTGEKPLDLLYVDKAASYELKLSKTFSRPDVIVPKNIKEFVIGVDDVPQSVLNANILIPKTQVGTQLLIGKAGETKFIGLSTNKPYSTDVIQKNVNKITQDMARRFYKDKVGFSVITGDTKTESARRVEYLSELTKGGKTHSYIVRASEQKIVSYTKLPSQTPKIKPPKIKDGTITLKQQKIPEEYIIVSKSKLYDNALTSEKRISQFLLGKEQSIGFSVPKEYTFIGKQTLSSVESVNKVQYIDNTNMLRLLSNAGIDTNKEYIRLFKRGTVVGGFTDTKTLKEIYGLQVSKTKAKKAVEKTIVEKTKDQIKSYYKKGGQIKDAGKGIVSTTKTKIVDSSKNKLKQIIKDIGYYKDKYKNLQLQRFVPEAPAPTQTYKRIPTITPQIKSLPTDFLAILGSISFQESVLGLKLLNRQDELSLKKTLQDVIQDTQQSQRTEQAQDQAQDQATVTKSASSFSGTTSSPPTPTPEPEPEPPIPPEPEPPKPPKIRIPRVPVGFFPWFDAERKKAVGAKKKKKSIFALTPDFTARALGITPQKLKKEAAVKEAKKVKTGVEIRTGVEIVDELDKF